MDDSQVSVDAHQHDKENSCIKSDVVHTEDQPTHEITKDPGISGIVSQEGESEDEKKVSDGQVQERHISHAFYLSSFQDHPQHQHVAQEADHEEQRVENRE
ncbi:uncharacterized [Tachysurus ichikawai]